MESLPISETRKPSLCYWRACAASNTAGYDSSGIAVLNGKGLEIMKKVGRIQQLESGLASHPLHGTLGISHTRWATHGKPTNANAHPHTDASGKLAIVHNGVIENYGALKKKLTEKGYTFKTETDTEVLAVLIGFHFDTLDAATENRLEMAVMESLREVTGTYGLVAIHQDQPGIMVGARRGSPLVLGIGPHEHFLASDVSAMAAHTQTVAHLRDFDVVTIDRNGYRLKSLTPKQGRPRDQPDRLPGGRRRAGRFSPLTCSRKSSSRPSRSRMPCAAA